MKTLQDHLCLNRPNFQINPRQSASDATLFFGREWNKELISNIETGYMAGLVPRIYLSGDYGTGKTHLLYHLKHHFEAVEGPRIMPLIVQVEAEGRTRYQALHKRLMDAIGIEPLAKAYIDYGFKDPARREEAYGELFPDANVFQVMQLLGTGPSNRTLAWRWLTGERLSTGDMDRLGVTSLLTETGDLVDLLVTVGELFRRVGRHLLFLIDEGEGLHAVTNADAQRSWHDAFRRLADSNDNQSVGWILTFYNTLAADAPSFMMEGDITTRLGSKGQVRLDPLEKVEVRAFIRDLLRSFVDRQKATDMIGTDGLSAKPDEYPFTSAGLTAFIEHAAMAPHNAIPRTILRALTACALEALREGPRVIDRDIVDQVVPVEFADQG